MTAAQAETNATWLMVELVVVWSLSGVIIDLRTSVQPPMSLTQADTGPRMKVRLHLVRLDTVVTRPDLTALTARSAQK